MTSTPKKRAAFFLDRDGVLIENRAEYVRCWDDVAFYPSALQALASIADTDYAVVMVTNQSAVGRGILSLDDAWAISDEIVKVVQTNHGRVDATYLCSHVPADDCSCRKPEPGLLLQAAEELAIDMSRSCMIGDALSDMLAGRAAGVGSCFLVRTGRGQWQQSQSTAMDQGLFTVVDDLAAAVDFFLTSLSAGDDINSSHLIANQQLKEMPDTEGAGKG